MQKPCITWRQAEELLREGWEIGAHTATHPKLAEVLDDEGPEAMMDEIERSNESYRANLGFVPDHFAYPSGSRDERTDSMLASALQVAAALDLQPSAEVGLHGRPYYPASRPGVSEYRQHCCVQRLRPNLRGGSGVAIDSLGIRKLVTKRARRSP